MSEKLESRFLKLVRPDDDCEQAIKEFKDLSLVEGIGRLNELLIKAGGEAQSLYLPQLVGHEYNRFSNLLATARMLSSLPQAELLPKALKGVIDTSKDIPEPAFVCQVETGETIDVSHDSVSELLVFEGDHQIFRDLQWFFRCWGAVIQGVWASKLFCEIHRHLNGQLALGSSLVVQTDDPEVVTDWITWEGSAWDVIELSQYSDDEIKTTWKRIDEIVRSNGAYSIDPVGPFHEWFKTQTIKDIEEMGLTDEQVSALLFCSAPGRHRPNIDIDIEFSVEAQRFLLSFPLKVHDIHGHNRDRLVLPEPVLNRFLESTGDQTKASLVRTLLHAKRYAIIRLTGEMIEPDLY